MLLRLFVRFKMPDADFEGRGSSVLDIPALAQAVKIERITNGWSRDQKYYVETATKEKFLLRIAELSQYDKKKHEFEMMKRLAESGVPMSQPVDFGICDNGKRVYTLLTWCDGETAEIALPRMSEARQYQLGVAAGQILRNIHSIPAPTEQEPWDAFFNQKVDRKRKQYLDCGIKFEGDGLIMTYLDENRHLLSRRPQCFQHGDYHVGNMIISPEGNLQIIDFNRCDYGDPWEEFNRIVWSAAVSPHFATGQIRGYFDGDPPDHFFRLLAFYISSNTLASIPWAIPFGERDVATMLEQARDVLSWFDGMQNPIPSWYLSDFYIQQADQVPYKLKAPHGF